VIAERSLTAVVRRLNRRFISHERPAKTLPAPEPGKEYVLYCHVPFCQRLCTYCGFNRFLYNHERATLYYAALRDEMRMVADMGYDFVSMYLGGGTPTILVDELCKTIDLAHELFGIREVSCETSPNHLDAEMIEKLHDRVQRMSVGVQSFDDMLLDQMDRYSKYGCGEDTFDAVKNVAGAFQSLNVDMIFNFPSQTDEMLLRDIALLKETGANQTTFYPLMASPETGKSLAHTIGRISYEKECRFYEILTAKLSESFEPSSAWTFSKRGGGMIDEYIVDYDEYVGIGSGAMSFLDNRVYGNTFSLSAYHDAIDNGRLSVTTVGDEYSPRARRVYRFATELFGLSLDKKRFQRDFGISVELGLPVEYGFMKAAGAFDRDDSMLTLTDKGRYLVLVMMRVMLAGQNELRDVQRAALPEQEKSLLLDNANAVVPARVPAAS
jgi:coproporphyrinogen III oxidase-like Fe-S oxidoreductase